MEEATGGKNGRIPDVACHLRTDLLRSQVMSEFHRQVPGVASQPNPQRAHYHKFRDGDRKENEQTVQYRYSTSSWKAENFVCERPFPETVCAP